MASRSSTTEATAAKTSSQGRLIAISAHQLPSARKFPVTIQALVKDRSPDLSEWQRDRLASFYASREGKYVQITVRDQGKPRSLNQNAYYHGVVVKLLGDELGYNPEEMHDILKWKFLPRQFVAFGSDQVPVVKSTTRLSTSEFEEYLERIRVFAATELSVIIPLPHESV